MNLKWHVLSEGGLHYVVRDCAAGGYGELDSTWRVYRTACSRAAYLLTCDAKLVLYQTRQVWCEDMQLYLVVLDLENSAGRCEPSWTFSRN